MEDKAFFNSIHRLGRISTLISIVVFLVPAFVIWSIYGFPKLAEVMVPLATLFATLAPGHISEALSYAPILGSSSYMAFITGNIMNLKIPVAISAQKIVDAEPNTPKADVVSTMAIAVSSIETIIIIAIGTLLLSPLQPVLQTEMAQTASNFIVPALFGGMAMGIFVKNSGKEKIERKWMICILPLVIISICLAVIPSFANYQGYAVIAMILVTIGWAYLLFKKGIVKVVDATKNEETEE